MAGISVPGPTTGLAPEDETVASRVAEINDALQSLASVTPANIKTCRNVNL